MSSIPGQILGPPGLTYLFRRGPMLYRALDCGVFGGQEPLTTVFFDADAGVNLVDRLVFLLSKTWVVPASKICVGNLDCVLDIERASVQGEDAGDRRWFEVSSWRSLALYVRGPTIFLCSGHTSQRLTAAATAAIQHERAIATVLDATGDARGYCSDHREAGA